MFEAFFDVLIGGMGFLIPFVLVSNEVMFFYFL